MQQAAHTKCSQQLQSWIYQTLTPTRVRTKQTALVVAVEASPKSLASIAEAVLASPTTSDPLRRRLQDAITASQHLDTLSLPTGHGWRNKLHVGSHVGKARQRTSWVSGCLRNVEDGGLNDDDDLVRECCKVLQVDPDPSPTLPSLPPRKPETTEEWDRLECQVRIAQNKRRRAMHAVWDSWMVSYSDEHEECKQLMERDTYRPLLALPGGGDAGGYDASSEDSSSSDEESCEDEECEIDCEEEDAAEEDAAEDAEAANDFSNYSWIVSA